MNRKVSIIVPCYNQGKYLSETLDSVVSQTYQNWECIIVNDGSPDNTAEIAELYCNKDCRFKYLYQKNSGVSAARNAGIAKTDGFYILPLDADDLIAPDYLLQAVTFFDNNPSYKLVYCKARTFGSINKEWHFSEYNFDTLLWRNCIFCSAMYKRQDFLLTSGYNTNMTKGWEDWDFWLSLLKKDDLVYCLNSVLFYYRIKEQSRNTEANKNLGVIYKQILNNHRDLYLDIIDHELELYAKSKYLEQDVYDIIHSRSYKLGSLLTLPIRIIKKKLKFVV